MVISFLILDETRGYEKSFSVGRQRDQYENKIDDLSAEIKELKRQIDEMETRAHRKRPDLTLYIEPVADNHESADSVGKKGKYRR